MPYISVQIAAESISTETVARLSKGITGIMSDILGKKRSLVAASIETVSPDRWFIAGRAVKSDESTTAFVTARITQGTNTEKEKSQAIQAIFQLLEQVLGTMEMATYVVLETSPATDWGYSGITQQDRQPDVRRLENGAIDTKHYLRRSRRLRSACIVKAVLQLVNRMRRDYSTSEDQTCF